MADWGEPIARMMIAKHLEMQKRRANIAVGNQLVHLEIPDPTDPKGEKRIPLFDKKHIDAWDKMNFKEQSNQAASYETMARMLFSEYQSRESRKGQMLNNQRFPTQIGNESVPLTAAQHANVLMAQQPKDLTPEQQASGAREVQKMLQTKIKESPEWKFQNDHGLMPKQVLFNENGIPDTAQQGYKLLVPINPNTGTNWGTALLQTAMGNPMIPTKNAPKIDPNGAMTEVAPAYDENGVPKVPDWVKQQVDEINSGIKDEKQKITGYQWQATGDVFRGDFYKPSSKAPEQIVPNPEGSMLSIQGKNIPYSDVQGINQRHAQVFTDAANAILSGTKNPQHIQDLYEGLGYDPTELPAPKAQPVQ